jgi:hypothetical protein
MPTQATQLIIKVYIQIMHTAELKSKMMQLWKNTFHDSDAYISLVFDTYFNPDLIAYNEENGKLVSAMLGVPYEFGNGGNKLKGLYLCGLATQEEFRHRGIMNDLIEKINTTAIEKGYDFTFLIPATDALINYYSARGYNNAIYRVEDRYTEVHDFAKNYRSILMIEDERVSALKTKYFDSLITDFINPKEEKTIDEIIQYIMSSEENITTYISLRHSAKDLHAVIKENDISKGKIVTCRNNDKKLTGLAFVTVDDKKRVNIPKIYYDDNCSLYKLLDSVKKYYSDFSLSLYCYPEDTGRRALWSKVYAAANPDGGMLDNSFGITERVYNVSLHARPYGMIRILNCHEVLKFVANHRSDVKFSILVKEYNYSGNALKCDVVDGKIKFEYIPDNEIKNYMANPSITVLNHRELMEILFRKKDSSNLIMEAFGIPRLAMNMALLLD